MNLVEHDILTSPTFSGLPGFAEVTFQGFPADKVARFAAEREGEAHVVLAASLIRREEKFLWESAQDLLDGSMQAAQALVRGVYRFDLLNFDPHREMRNFSPQEFTQVIVNTSRRMTIGQQRLIKYSSAYGLLFKISEEEWGKIAFKPAVEVFNQEPDKLDLYLKRLVNLSLKFNGRKMIVVQDLSQQPIYDPANAQQRARLGKSFDNQASLFEEQSEIFLHTSAGWVDLRAALG